MKSKKKKIILVCSNGGHLAQILELREMFMSHDYLLITEESPTTLPLKEKYNVKFLKARSIGMKRNFNFFWILFINSCLSLKMLIQHYPKVIITTGSHTALPMLFLGKLLGSKIIWILSFARINSKAFSADMAYPIVDKFIVQWPDAQKFYKNSVLLGGIY